MYGLINHYTKFSKYRKSYNYRNSDKKFKQNHNKQ